MARRRNGAAGGAFVGSLLGALAGALAGAWPGAALGSVAGGAIGGGLGARSDRRRRGAVGGGLGGLLAPPGAALGGYLAAQKPDRAFTRRSNPELGRLEDRSPAVADELCAAAAAFEGAVPAALEECFDRYPPKHAPDEIYDDPQTPLLIYGTLAGGAYGIWSGPWDPYYPNRGRRHWNRLQTCLRAELAPEYQRLEAALVAAAHALHDNPRQRRARMLARKLTR